MNPQRPRTLWHRDRWRCLRRCCGGCRRRGIGLWLRSSSGRQHLDPSDEVGGIRRFIAGTLVARKLRSQHVSGFQQGVDHDAREIELVPAHTVEQRFQFMRQVGDIVESERCGATFDRMGDAEDGIQFFVAWRRNIDFQQKRFHAGQVFASFLKEDCIELREIESPALLQPLVAYFAHDFIPSGSCSSIGSAHSGAGGISGLPV